MRAEQLQDTITRLGQLRVGGGSDWPALMESIRGVMGAEVVGHYHVDVTAAGARLDWIGGAGVSRAQLEAMLTSFTALTRGFRQLLAYDPGWVNPSQRNVPMTYTELLLAGTTELTIENTRLLTRKNLGAGAHHQLRVVLSEGPSMLGYLGVYRGTSPGDFGLREKRTLRQLVPALVERLRLERRLAHQGLQEATLDAALEALGQPAWVVNRTGDVLHTNRAGLALLRADRRALTERLRQVLAGGLRAAFSTAHLRGPGLPAYSLLVARGTEAGVEARLRDCATAWNLSPRVVEVLRGVVRGLSNVAIARELGVVERTIEVHVSTLLEAARVENRASLIAAVYGGT
jgi:PAS domain-containing protein